MSRALRRLAAREEGIAMVLVILIGSLMTLLSVTLIELVRSESTRGARANWSNTAFQAAEAGIDDYVAKLVDDHGFYLHYVAPAESTRSPSLGVSAPHSSDCTAASSFGAKTTSGIAWTYGTTWTYDAGKNNWCRLPNGYFYNLQVYPPGSAANATTAVRVVATGRRSMSSTDDMRSLETYVRPSNLTDFYRFSNGSVSIDAETYGKIYSNSNVSHTGTAHADIFAEGSITGSPNMVDGAQKYENGAFPPSKIKNHPIDFSKFLVSLVDIKRAAEVGGVYLNEVGKTGWRIIFSSAGTFTAAPCSGSNLQDSPAPTCTPAVTYSVPSNGAIYTDVDAIVSGSVNGRVTVGSGQNVVVAANIAPTTPGDDVIGLVAYSDLWVAGYAPSLLTWNAAVLVQTNTWHSAGASHGAGSLMTFSGSSATALGGSFGAYASRIYAYDANLQFLPPPWFPAIDDTYVTTFFREVAP
jgi:hypothetical protein